MENEETREDISEETDDEHAIARTVDYDLAEGYPGNSYRSRQRDADEEPDEKETAIKPVAHGSAVKRKKTLKEKIAGWLFVDEEDYEDYIYEDFIRPAVTDAIGDLSHNVFDTVLDAIDTALFGDSGRRGRYRRRSSRYYRDDDDWGEYWNRERRSRRRRSDQDRDDDRRRSRRSDDVAAQVETRKEAVDLIESMQRRVHRFKCASVLNFYELADMPTRSTDDNYGWDLGHPFEATISRTRDGYIVEPVAPIWLDR